MSLSLGQPLARSPCPYGVVRPRIGPPSPDAGPPKNSGERAPFFSRLFLAALRLKAGLGEVIDLRHSVEPQDLSDCRAPLPVAPVSGGEETRRVPLLKKPSGHGSGLPIK